ncbi:MAG: YciI family protein [Clostridiales bacterium]
MQFLVLGYDGKDEQALERRMRVRDQHLAGAEKMFKDKTLLYAAAMVDEKNEMIGSMMVVDFPSKEAMEKEWLAKEPYIEGKVWETIEIKPCKVPGFCLK